MRAICEKIPSGHDRSFSAVETRVPRFTTPWHFHPECELIYIAHGSGTRFVGDSIHPFERGDLVLLGPNLPHTWQNHKAARRAADYACALVVQFRADFLGPGFFALVEMKPVARLLAAAERGVHFPDAEVVRDTALCMKNLVAQTGADRIITLLSILEKLTGAPKQHLLSSPGFEPALHAFDEQRMEKISAYVIHHLGEEITRKVAAELVHMSEGAFSRFFRQKAGKSFTEFVNEVRIGRAAHLLIESEQPVSEIAFACGFNNLSHFHRRFRRTFALSPTAYVRQFRSCAAKPPSGADSIHIGDRRRSG